METGGRRYCDAVEHGMVFVVSAARRYCWPLGNAGRKVADFPAKVMRQCPESAKAMAGREAAGALSETVGRTGPWNLTLPQTARGTKACGIALGSCAFRWPWALKLQAAFGGQSRTMPAKPRSMPARKVNKRARPRSVQCLWRAQGRSISLSPARIRVPSRTFSQS